MSTASLNKLSQLPLTIRNQLSAPEFMEPIEELETKYGIKLVILFVSLVVGELDPKDLSRFLATKFNLNSLAVEDIANRLLQLLQMMNKSGINGHQQTPPPFRPDSSVADFRFSIDDEDEINFLRLGASPAPADYNQLVETIMSDFGFIPGDEVLKKRLANIILSRIKDLRDEMETRNVLQKSRKVGGLDFNEDQSDELLDLIKEKLRAGVLKNVVASAETAVVKPELPKASEQLAELKAEIESVKPKIAKQKLTEEQLTIKPIAGGSGSKNSTIAIREEDGLPVISMPDDERPVVAPPRPTAIKSPPIKIPDPINPAPQPLPTHPIKKLMASAKISPNQMGYKPKMDDVRFVAKTMGPIEELANMTLMDFRRLGATAQKMTAKITEKIDLLEKDSLARRIEGINAWHKNEVSRFYRLLGQESMKTNTGIEKIITSRTQANKPTLSIDEFHAIMELNKGLRY